MVGSAFPSPLSASIQFALFLRQNDLPINLPRLFKENKQNDGQGKVCSVGGMGGVGVAVGSLLKYLVGVRLVCSQWVKTRCPENSWT